MANISNTIRCKLMNRLLHGQDITEMVQTYGISERTIENCRQELEMITGNRIEEDQLTSAEIQVQKNRFRKYSWQIIDKANHILSDKLNQLSAREKTLDNLIAKIEECLLEDNYDKAQMGKLIKLFESSKQNSITELARIIQIFYGKQDEMDSITDEHEDDFEKMIENLTGDNF